MLADIFISHYMEKYGHKTDGNTLQVHELSACRRKRVCRRKWYRLGVEELMSVKPSIVIGELIHEGLSTILSKHGYIPDVEARKAIEVDGKVYEIIGHADLVKKDTVYEIKYARQVKRHALQHHRVQVSLYKWLLNVDKAVIIYFTPDETTMYRVDGAVGDGWVKSHIRQWMTRTPLFSWECTYCPYRDLCRLSFPAENGRR